MNFLHLSPNHRCLMAFCFPRKDSFMRDLDNVPLFEECDWLYRFVITDQSLIEKWIAKRRFIFRNGPILITLDWIYPVCWMQVWMGLYKYKKTSHQMNNVFSCLSIVSFCEMKRMPSKKRRIYWTWSNSVNFNGILLFGGAIKDFKNIH